ncbi:hypothetical protein [Kitasatospora sp. NPDC096140]|uniref:hypothetical protein n=1 Tax=Kitasatospora sp. NPDC096140 TaxID=3155425 RepID=UPI00331CAEE4
MPQLTPAPSTDCRRRCTGETHQALQALQALRQAGKDGSAIPVARHPDQAALEAAVFLAACKMGGLSPHPLGILKVRPEPERLTIRLLDEPLHLDHARTLWKDGIGHSLPQ